MDKEIIRNIFDYDDKTGELRWKIGKQRIHIGDIAGYLEDGYRRVRVNGKLYAAHRLIWLWHYGKFPDKQIDHINGKRDDNRISNLREADSKENGQNRKRSINNSTGHTGVSWSKHHCKYWAYIKIDQKTHHIGFFLNYHDACSAYKKVKSELHQFNPILREDV
jgi:hypothetical protein